MEPDDQCGHRPHIDVMDLVDCQHDPGVMCTCHFAELDEETGQISGKVPGVCGSVDGVDIDAELGAILLSREISIPG